MKRFMVMFVALLAIVAIAMPAFAVEFKYGGLFRLRWHSDNNLSGTPGDDDQNYMDQRLRMYFTFIASENLQVVTKWEMDTQWGQEVTGGDSGADAIRLEMKNVYVDFNIPYTPVRAMLGVQGITIEEGWIIDDDFSAAVFSTAFEPLTVKVGYIAIQNEDVSDFDENIDVFYADLGYTYGPLTAGLIGYWQIGNDTNVSTAFNTGSGLDFQDNAATPFNESVEDNNLVDLGITLGYKMDWMDAKINFVKNFGSYDIVGSPDSTDYEGYMVEAMANFYVNAFTFTLGGFFTSGDDDPFDGDDNAFRYPDGASHYWSEIMGLGTLDASTPGTNDRIADPNKGAYSAADAPSNLWTVYVGAAWQALETTKLTLTYYYIGTDNEVVSEIIDPVTNAVDFDDSIGHEINFYLDQDVVDGLKLRFVAAYLFANDALTIYEDDDDIYEIGARLQWAF